MRYKRLYECFTHWYHGGEIFFYSDPHFNDNEMMYLRENYIGDEEQVKRINSVIGRTDTLILLGDIGDIEFLKKVRGYKVLILGNHDRGATYYKDVVDEVYTGPLLISDKLILSHQRIDVPFFYNVHGHEHNHGDTYNSMNVCCENIGYVPIRLSAVLDNENFRNIENIHTQQIRESVIKNENRE